MPGRPNAFLIDLLTMHDTAATHDCGLEPQLLEMLLDTHAALAGTVALDQPIRTDGPPQAAPPGLAQATRPAQASKRLAHARR